MSKTNKPTRTVRPKTQREIGDSFVNPYDPAYGNPNKDISPALNRGERRSFKGDTTKPFSIGLTDIDETLNYYFVNVVKPFVIQDGQRIEIPVIYGDAEKWKLMQKDGYYRDKEGKIMAPLITYKRTNIENYKGVGIKLLDTEYPYNFGVFQQPFNKRNIYDNFAALNNRKPEVQYYGVVYPDFVTLTYEVSMYTYYIEQMNKVIESIHYLAGTYWGDPERFKFKANIEGYATSVELQQDKDRIVKTGFTIKMNGYLIPDILNKDIDNIAAKFSSKSKVTFTLETTGSL